MGGFQPTKTTKAQSLQNWAPDDVFYTTEVWLTTAVVYILSSGFSPLSMSSHLRIEYHMTFMWQSSDM